MRFGPRAKYVFLFIGDGMASVQIHAAEAYLANLEEHDDVGGSEKTKLLNLSQLPIRGMQMTFPWNSLITDSAPAASAMATGKKTADGVSRICGGASEARSSSSSSVRSFA